MLVRQRHNRVHNPRGSGPDLAGLEEAQRGCELPRSQADPGPDQKRVASEEDRPGFGEWPSCSPRGRYLRRIGFQGAGKSHFRLPGPVVGEERRHGLRADGVQQEWDGLGPQDQGQALQGRGHQDAVRARALLHETEMRIELLLE